MLVRNAEGLFTNPDNLSFALLLDFPVLFVHRYCVYCDIVGHYLSCTVMCFV